MDVRCVFVWPFILWKVVDRWQLLVGLVGPVTPYSSAADQREREKEREQKRERCLKRSNRTRENRTRILSLKELYPAVIVSTGGYIPSWRQQAWQNDWFWSSIMASYECWVWLWGTIRATMADKTLSAPQRSEGPFHACPWAGRAAESWWPAGSLALVA